jgi:molybdopterin synthase sulfur carrier subunit
MITVHFFASLREALNTNAMELAPDGVASVEDVISKLVTANGERWAQVLRHEKVMVAVNQQVADLAAVVNNGDEVAFFPPVTGG